MGLVPLTAVAGGLLVALIGLAFTLVLWSIVGLGESTASERHTHTALTQARTAEGLIVDLETGQRGFVITGQNQFLEPWETARTTFSGQAQQLVRLSTTPGQRRLAQQISQAGESLIRDYSIPLVAAARRGDPTARGVAATLEGKRRVDALRQQFLRYDSRQEALIAARESAADDDVREAVVAASIGLTGSILLIAAFAGYVIRAVVWPVRKAADVASRLAGGDLAVRMPETGRGEIGQLGTAFNTMAGSLEESREQARHAHERLRLLYEASFVIGTTLDAEQTAQELVRVAVPRFADFVTVDLALPVLLADEPLTDHGTQARRVALGGVRDDPPLDLVGSQIALSSFTPHIRDIAGASATFVPDLRTSSAWQVRHGRQARRLLDYGMHSLITAPLYSRRMLVGAVGFWRSENPSPFEEDDLSDAQEIAAKAAVAIDNARRYARERDTALTLQRSLLPRSPKPPSGIEIAHRYTPASDGSEVGGDWYDVAALSPDKAAIAIGDVMGHGIPAAAVMGQMRSTLRALVRLDLPPDQLLHHLDQAMQDLDSPILATCLYGVCDAAANRCWLARAGHPPPALITPDGTARLIDLPPGAPLGIGGITYTTTEIPVTPGTVLVLYTDGLVEARGYDLDERLEELTRLLTGIHPSLDQLADTLINRLAPTPAQDDIAILIARVGTPNPR
ncbi:SpoIIE family protein phosphatase [Streptantibioticus ferralitis]|uniref:SpoIIE family protein phosphatase n=1 Tax=Streptantibioticus ferralitis TaxID=236510 RepID=A0ABT5YYX5_9ACTN|nr:SpoIIE family protein phosphatase [Streptantibioticus ferralitis]MDF2255990.1 SpoIIE family protein phosphatase [Streptantibioticus ferralitis]